MPRLIVGCPIANRAWAVGHWVDCLARQTRRPDAFAFIHSGDGDTMTAMWRCLLAHRFDTVRVQHDARPAHPRHDNARFATLAALRNQLLNLVQSMGADLFLSLDSDIMLEDPRTIERLCDLVDDGADIAQPVTFLHPLAPRTWSPAEQTCWAYNFGWLSGDTGPRARWTRPSPNDLPWGSVMRITVPMACWLGNRCAIDCRYEPHESGEDIGYALSLRRAGVECVVDSGLYAPHVWEEGRLREWMVGR